MFRLLGDWLAEYVDIREQLNQRIFREAEEFLTLTEQLEERIHLSGALPCSSYFSSCLGRSHPVLPRSSTPETKEKCDLEALFLEQ